MSKFEVIRGVEGCCLALDGTRIAGPKPWGGGKVIHTWETDKKYRAVASPPGIGECEIIYKGDLVWQCQSCNEQMRVASDSPNFCPNCGRRAV